MMSDGFKVTDEEIRENYEMLLKNGAPSYIARQAAIDGAYLSRALIRMCRKISKAQKDKKGRAESFNSSQL